MLLALTPLRLGPSRSRALNTLIRERAQEQRSIPELRAKALQLAALSKRLRAVLAADDDLDASSLVRSLIADRLL